MLRKMFQVCFNKYRDQTETYLSDKKSRTILEFSPRLFEIKYSQRMEPVGFIQKCNMFVVTKGEAARCLNFYSGTKTSKLMRNIQNVHISPIDLQCYHCARICFWLWRLWRTGRGSKLRSDQNLCTQTTIYLYTNVNSGKCFRWNWLCVNWSYSETLCPNKHELWKCVPIQKEKGAHWSNTIPRSLKKGYE